MKTIFGHSILAFCFLLFLTGCGRSKTIPDDKLGKIFEDIFLVNSYYNTVGGELQADSIDVYGPILKKYGYRVKDLTYTIENYSKRKSKRISDVVESSIRNLENAERYYAGLVTKMDTLEARALRKFARTVYYDTAARHIFSLDDTAGLRIEIPVREGNYRIDIAYFIDSLDRNGRSASVYELLDSSGIITNRRSRGLSTRTPANVSISVDTKPDDKTLRLRFAGYGPNMKDPHVTIDSILIVYTLPAKVALDSLASYYMDQILTWPPYAELSDADTTYRSALRADPPRLPERGDDNDRPGGDGN